MKKVHLLPGCSLIRHIVGERLGVLATELDVIKDGADKTVGIDEISSGNTDTRALLRDNIRMKGDKGSIESVYFSDDLYEENKK